MSYVIPYIGQLGQSGKNFSTSFAINGVASQYSLISLFNPVSNTKNLNLFSANITCTQQVNVVISSVNSLLSGSLVTAPNNLLGGPTTTANVIVANAGLPTELGFFKNRWVLAYTLADLLDGTNQLLVIPPGFGIVMRAGVVNITMSGDLSWFEN